MFKGFGFLLPTFVVQVTATVISSRLVVEGVIDRLSGLGFGV